jgi:hypothetical protein
MLWSLLNELAISCLHALLGKGSPRGKLPIYFVLKVIMNAALLVTGLLCWLESDAAAVKAYTYSGPSSWASTLTSSEEYQPVL